MEQASSLMRDLIRVETFAPLEKDVVEDFSRSVFSKLDGC